MIIGAHSIIYSKNAERDRNFLRKVLKLTHVDVGEGWLIFGLPPAEVAVHPGGKNDIHEFYLMCDDVEGFVRDMKARGHRCAPIQDMGWGILTQIRLPGGGDLGVYQPRHARPKTMSARSKKPKSRRAAKTRTSKPARKVAARKTRRASTR